jgi:TfoX/Sxy family transcriptional regulator of competence genes
MTTTVDYIEYVCEQDRSAGDIRYKKMFIEYMVYVDDKPFLLVCDD